MSSFSNQPNDNTKDDKHEENDTDHYFLVLPPHSVLDLLGSAFQIVGLVAHHLAFFDQDLDFFASFDNFVHVLQRDLFKLSELFLKFRQLIHLGLIGVK